METSAIQLIVPLAINGATNMKGALTVIPDSAPALLLEVQGNPDDPGSGADDIFRFLRAAGYTPYWFDGAKLNKMRSADRCINCFFLSAEHLKTLEKQGAL
jgi:hypothetical protein